MFRPLLKLKHWQFFLIQVGGVVLFQIIIFATVFQNFIELADSHREPQPEEVFGMMKIVFYIIPFIILFSLYFRYGWQWAIVKEFKDKLPQGVKIPFKRIKAFFIIPIAIMILFIFFMFDFMFEIMADPEAFVDQKEPPVKFISMMLVFFPLNLFSTFCIFHNYVFTAKTLKSVELQKNVKFEDYAGDFFCIWFQIIGIWILQPKINRIYEGDISTTETSEILDDRTGVDDEVI